MSRPLLVWFRRDLRLADNPALHAACKTGSAVIPVYIHSPMEEGPGAPGAASRFWLHQALREVDASLQKKGSKLIFRQGASLAVLEQLIEETGAVGVYWNRRYEALPREHDARIKKTLTERGLDVQRFNGNLLVEPWTAQTKTGGPYKVFTPFYRSCMASFDPRAPLPAPTSILSPEKGPASLLLESLGLDPEIPWAEGIRSAWRFGENGAHQRLQHFLDSGLVSYQSGRDHPADDHISRMSPYLQTGEISPYQIVEAVQAFAASESRSGLIKGAEAYVRELFWREFSYHLLYHFPFVTEKPLRPEFEDFEWDHRPDRLRAWQRGLTGYPIVDAGMRQLWQTGWMHNRVRMITASFLIKDLFIHWKEGMDWFWDTLVDADLANNTQGWQWTAGCGADAAPYFRIFNPITQGKKFDSEGTYVRRYVPELAKLPDQWIHQPWEAPGEVLRAAKVTLGESYPRPLVDHAVQRDEAMERYNAMRGE